MAENKSMKIVIDENRFDEMQMSMLQNMIKGIKETLEEGKLPEEQIEDLTGNVAFAVSCIIDSSTIMEHEGKPLRPSLGFSLDDDGKEILVSENGSWMHEYVFGAVDEVFEGDG